MVATSNTPVNLSIKAGLPYKRRFRLVNGTAVWPALGTFELRSQLRKQATVTSDLILDFAEYMAPTIEDTDIVITLTMTGAQTRALPTTGYYDIVLSDPGEDDAKAVCVIPASKITTSPLVTAPS